MDRYINDLEPGSTVLGNLDLVGLVIIKNSYQWEKLDTRNKLIKMLTKLCDNLNNWKNEDEVLKLFKSDDKDNRFSKENRTLQSLKRLFDQDLILVK